METMTFEKMVKAEKEHFEAYNSVASRLWDHICDELEAEGVPYDDFLSSMIVLATFLVRQAAMHVDEDMREEFGEEIKKAIPPKDRAAHKARHDDDSYHRRAILDPPEQGRHKKESKVVGHDASPYPAATPGSPWNSSVNSVLNSAVDVTGVDTLKAPITGEAFEVREAALIKELRRLSGEQKALDPSHPDVQELQVRIDEIHVELARGRR
jgi:hypothetical protein